MQIVTDCAADLPEAEIRAMNITVAPLYIRFPEGEVNSADLTPDQFYDRLAAMRPAIPTTAQPSQRQFSELYEQLAQAGQPILSIHISSGLSGTLEYLARGGRIGRVQALAGALLHLKPVIHVSKADGKYSAVAKARTMGKAIEAVTDHLAHLYDATAPMWVTIMHGKFAEQAAALSKALQARLTIARLEMLRISPVLGVHTGPGIVGAVVVPMAVFDGLV